MWLILTFVFTVAIACVTGQKCDNNDDCILPCNPTGLKPVCDPSGECHCHEEEILCSNDNHTFCQEKCHNSAACCHNDHHCHCDEPCDTPEITCSNDDHQFCQRECGNKPEACCHDDHCHCDGSCGSH